jgi:four helix bundle protein
MAATALSGGFCEQLNECEGEAAESQTWLQFAVESNYLQPEDARPLYQAYDDIIGMLIRMQNHPEKWILTKEGRPSPSTI